METTIKKEKEKVSMPISTLKHKESDIRLKDSAWKLKDSAWKQKDVSGQPLSDDYVNKIIEVYKTGIKKGEETAMIAFKDKIKKDFDVNLKKAFAVGENFYEFLNKTHKSHCSTVYLKAESLNDFRLLFLIDSKKYLSKGFDKVYQKSIIERRKYNNDKFHVSLMFIPEGQSLDKEKIKADGYRHSFNGKAAK